MTLQLSTIKTTREALAWNASAPEISTENELTLQGKATVQISRSAIHIRDGYGERERVSFRYWSDHSEVENAVVDFVAALHDGLSSDSENVRSSARELLARILGAAGAQVEG